MDRHATSQSPQTHGGSGPAIGRKSSPSPPAASTDLSKPDDRVTRLAKGIHPVEVGLNSDKTAEIFKAAIDRGYVHIKFMGTKGGTELEVWLDQQTSD